MADSSAGDVGPAPPVRSSTPGATPKLVPCLMLARGRVMIPGEEGPTIARDPSGRPLELFDVADFLTERYPRLYVVDLDGIEHGRMQLDWLQEIARDTDIWVNAGVVTGAQAIDVLITGASRAVISSTDLRGRKDLVRAWGLSTSLAFEIAVHDGRAVAHEDTWNGADPVDVVRQVREVGLSDVIFSPRPDEVDWALARRLVPGGPLWVNGSFAPEDSRRLAEVGAAGGIFHIAGLLADWQSKEAS